MYNHRLVIFIILVCNFNYPAFAKKSSEDLNPAEQYVIEQVINGKLADFSKYPEDNRILSVDFLKQLLTGSIHGLEIPKKGIHIYGARIIDKLDFSEGKFPFPISFRACIFDKEIGFSQTTYSEEVNFTSAKFSGGAYFGLTEFSGGAVFAQAEFSSEAVFSSAIFSGKVDFSSAKFSGEADFTSTEYSEVADFSSAQYFQEADFTSAIFSEKVDFRSAKFFEEADFSWTEYSEKVDFSSAKFSEEADFSSAIFSGKVDFSSAKFSGGADFSSAKFSEEADFRKAVLRKADLGNANLSGANLSEVDLSEANLKDTALKDCKLYNAELPLNYEPKAGSPPYIPSIADFKKLSALTFTNSPHGLVDLREGFKKLGYREQEREITYAIKYTQRCKLWNSKENSISDKFESSFYYFFFELTCQYGLKPGLPLLILVGFIFLFTIPYTLSIWLEGKDGIWAVWIPERVRKDLGSNEPFRLAGSGLSVLKWSFYFSILSAFSIGWRELNVGNWIARIQKREYTLRPTGWVRTVSGFQSLVSVYLLALWVLVYFGRPFEGI